VKIFSSNVLLHIFHISLALIFVYCRYKTSAAKLIELQISC